MPTASLEPQSLRPDQTIGVGGEPRLSGVRIQQFGVIEIDQRPVLQGTLSDPTVMRQAIRPRFDLPRGVELAVDILVAVTRRIKCRWRSA